LLYNNCYPSHDDEIVSSFAIHHYLMSINIHYTKRYIHILNLTGLFRVEHDMRFLCAIGYTAQMEDKSNIIYGDTIKISKGYRICRCGLLMEVACDGSFDRI
jgi:hypothetical protein